ncbi:MAG: AAA family ATPase, partial [Motiliproteus sp.]|nr:AAA family ATPase [Motiliproteus sp.]
MSQGFETAAVKAAQSNIMETLADSRRFVLVDGASGTGKSFLKAKLIRKLDQRYIVLDLPYSRFDVDELLLSIAESLKLPYDADDSDACFKLVQQRLHQQERSGRPVALLIDDAQFIPEETLISLARAIGGETPLLPLRGVLFGTPEVHQRLLFNHVNNEILSQHLLLTSATEAEMSQFIEQQVEDQSAGQISIDYEAMQAMLIAASGSLRNAIQLTKLAVIEARATGQAQINDPIVEKIQGENCFTQGLSFNNTDSDDTSIHHDLLPNHPQSDFDPTLGGLLTQSLLDTPDRPHLKQHSDRLETPLFINDLAAAEISSSVALHASAGQQQETPPENFSSQPSPPGVKPPEPVIEKGTDPLPGHTATSNMPFSAEVTGKISTENSEDDENRL